MCRRNFTLIELLIVISIIAILAGMTLQGFDIAIKGAKRADSNNNLKQITLGVIASQSGKKSTYSKDFLFPNGIRTLSTTESGHFAVDNVIIEGTTSSYQIFKKYKGMHPYDDDYGYYIFMGNTVNGGAKKKFSADTRVAMEFYPWDSEGDGKVGVAFGDGRVETLIVTTSPSDLNISEFLSIEGVGEEE